MNGGKKLTKKQWIKKLDRVFSEYVRVRDANEFGFCICITCGKHYHWKQIHCGHFISRAEEAVRYDELNCHSQCCACNTFKNGQPHIFRRELVKKHGKEAVEALEERARVGEKLTVDWLETKHKEYKNKVILLRIEKEIL